MTTPEGYFADENGALDWHLADAEFNQFAIDQLNQSEVLLFGRKTFELMQAYWPTAQAFADNPAIAGHMEGKTKIVVSKTLAASRWNNTQFIATDLLDNLINLKRQSEKDLLIFGSSKLAHSLLELGLIDEYRLLINPILLGKGKPMFGQSEKIRFQLINSKVFTSGNVLLCYALADAAKYASL